MRAVRRSSGSGSAAVMTWSMVTSVADCTSVGHTETTLRVLEEELRSRLAGAPLRPGERLGRSAARGRPRGGGVPRPKPGGWHPEASYHFVDGVTASIDKARELAGERTVAVNAGDVGSQIFAAGLVDEVAMDVVPVVFGSGKRYFGSIDGQHLLEDPHVVIQGDRVLH